MTPLDAEAFRRWHVRQLAAGDGRGDRVRSQACTSRFPRVERAGAPRLARALAREWRGARDPGRDRRRGARPRTGTRSRRTCRRSTAACRRPRGSRGTTLLAPFDSFLWHRERAHRLFGFRLHDRGLHAGPQAHARVLLAADPARRAAHRPRGPEDPPRRAAARDRPCTSSAGSRAAASPPAASWGAVDRDAALSGMADAFRSLAAFVGADTVSLGRVTPARSAPHSGVYFERGKGSSRKAAPEGHARGVLPVR